MMSFLAVTDQKRAFNFFNFRYITFVCSVMVLRVVDPYEPRFPTLGTWIYQRRPGNPVLRTLSSKYLPLMLWLRFKRPWVRIPKK